jgi:hypothetical protein
MKKETLSCGKMEYSSPVCHVVTFSENIMYVANTSLTGPASGYQLDPLDDEAAW